MLAIKLFGTSRILFLSIRFLASEIKEWQRISTGCDSIDNITRGGIPINGITEIYGTSGVGKTQMCLQLSLIVQLPKYLGGCEKGLTLLFFLTEIYHFSKIFRMRLYINRRYFSFKSSTSIS